MSLNQTKLQNPDSQHWFNRPLWSLGFRPFYLLGAIFASLLVPLWLLHMNGLLAINGPFSGSTWHAHEMIFGFAPAILTGFLYTAVRNWTGLPTPNGWKLAALAAVWLLARILMITGPSFLASLVDLAFLPLMALGLAVPIWKSNNRRNFIVVALVLGLFAANAAFHADAWGLIGFAPELAFATGLNIFAVFITLIAGRVMPMFINNAIPDASAYHIKIVEMTVVVGMVLVVVIEIIRGEIPSLDANPVFNLIYGAFLLSVVGLHLVRFYHWQPHKTRANPMVWILPLSYFWLIASVAMKALQIAFPAVDPLISSHILAIGAMGGMMLGMTTRSALGHTGRAIRASTVETGCFVLVQFAVLARLASFFLPADYYVAALSLTTAFWSLAFALFAIRYWPYLTRQRVDLAQQG